MWQLSSSQSGHGMHSTSGPLWSALETSLGLPCMHYRGRALPEAVFMRDQEPIAQPRVDARLPATRTRCWGVGGIRNMVVGAPCFFFQSPPASCPGPPSSAEGTAHGRHVGVRISPQVSPRRRLASLVMCQENAWDFGASRVLSRRQPTPPCSQRHVDPDRISTLQ